MGSVSFCDRLIHFLCNIPAFRDDPANLGILLYSLSDCPIHTVTLKNMLFADVTRMVHTAKSWGRIGGTGKHALLVLMEHTKEYVANTELEPQLDLLIDEFEQSVHGQVKIPFAVIAMTEDEAAELDSGSIFTNETELESFKEVKSALPGYGVGAFTSCYGNDRDDWKPLGEKRRIAEIVQDIRDAVNEERGEHSKIILKSLSARYLSSDPDDRRNARSMFREFGGILIVDTISMYHSPLRDRFFSQNKVLSQINPVAMVVVSPFSRNALEENKIIQEQVYRHVSMEDAFHYFEKSLDPRYEFGIDDMCYLSRWLYSFLPPEKRRRSGLTEAQQQAIRDKMGKVPKGLDTVVLGVEA